LRTPEGAAIRYGIAHPAARKERGSVLVLHGRAECLEKYGEIVEGLTARGLSVYSFDWHGQGLSNRSWQDGGNAEVRSFDDYLEDLALFVRELWCRPKVGRYLVAHSTGGHVALRFMVERGFGVDGAVLCAPLIDLQTRNWPRWLAPKAARTFITLGLGDKPLPGERNLLPSMRRFEGNSLTSDPRRFRILPDLVCANPRLECRGATFRWVDAAFRSIAKLNRPGLAENVGSPVAILIGDNDRVVDRKAAESFAARLPKGRFVLLENARHEIMMENDAILNRFWREVDEML
jgi:lysophospholipase